jgi:hypothetical protein
VKIYVAAVEALRKIERQGETQETIKIWWFPGFPFPPWMLMYFFGRVFLNLTLCMTKLRVLVLSFADFTDISIVRTLRALETLDSWELRNMSHELYLLCIIEHTVYKQQRNF